MTNIAVLAYPNMSLFEAACAMELFALPRPEFEHWYSCQLVAFGYDQVATNVGTSLTVHAIDDLSEFDLLIVPSWFTDNRSIPDNIRSAITDFFQQQKRIISYCSGAFLLAKLGLLHGREATTHWRYADTFQAQFAHITYREDVLYVFDGVIGCSAGSSAAIDLSLEIIRQDHSHDTANRVARRLVLSAHRKGAQSQFAETPVAQPNSVFASALDWAKAHLHEGINIDQIAQKANMSRRNFDRKFKANFNITPKSWLSHQQLDAAKSLLESSDLSIDNIAEHAGFQHGDVMRHHFRKHYGISPKTYRDNFHKKGAS
ncbi:GlxA family transcriptional regulator [Alteromonas sp. a30]|uniref:GlxA family transcriptional regulator n=1 Tax=Alteromonas sp. a30 TaxID=2730917 RepID=UPI00227DC2B4|nr:helix-turn-helix domain-containing protein [Alteromonas sp. a30]MCY7297093.1 helix-turn-helix domain-containing protein [Alteromonas sp. a30]